MRVTVCAHCLALSLLVATSARGEADAWLGPGEGDLEIRVSGDVSHLFTSSFTDFQIELALGYFFTDWLEGGLAAGVGVTKGSSAVDTTQQGVGVQTQALTINAVPRRHGGWHGSGNLWLRFFPFTAFAPELLPEVFAPFVGTSFGPQIVESFTPYLQVSASLGCNLYITEQIAFTPEVGYGLVIATDDAAKFEDSALEHAIAATWGLALFLSP